MIVRSSTGQSAAGRRSAGAASITVPGAIALRAKIPRPRVGLVRISTRQFGIGRWRAGSAAADTLQAGFRHAHGDDRQHPPEPLRFPRRWVAALAR